MEPSTNWAANINYRATEILAPSTTGELADLVRRADHVKARGTRHCFNDIADTDGLHISLHRMNRLLEVDPDAMTCTVEGGAQYSDFVDELDARGFALHNLASLANVSVAGACATATHGSGVASGSLATAVCAIEFVTADGAIVKLRDGDREFGGAVVNLGALGVVSKLTLRIETSYKVRQDAFVGLPFDELRRNFAAIIAAGESVSLYTNWRDRDISVALIKRRVKVGVGDFPVDFFGASAATETIGSLGSRDDRRSPQLGAELPWHIGLPHFRPDHRPAVGNELQSEYYVRPEVAGDAFAVLAAIGELINPVVVATEIRAVAADDQWLSPFYCRPMIGFHFTWKKLPAEVAKLLPIIENALAPFDPVPHWGKLFAIAPERIATQYEKMPEFVGLANRFDPGKKFANNFLRRFLEL